MIKQKVLIVSYSYPPANVPAAQRPYSIAKYLDKNKYDVTVLTCGNQDSSLGYNLDFKESLPNVKLIKVDGFKVSAERNIAKNNNTSLKKVNFKTFIKVKIKNILRWFVIPDKAIFWYPKVKKYIKSNKNDMKFDVIFSTSPLFTNHLVAIKIKKTNPKAIHIADFRDFHYLENQQFKKGIKSYINKVLEKKILNAADKITFISDAMRLEYEKFYTKLKDKFYTIYNGFDIDEYDLSKADQISNKKLTIFYAGSFYKGIRDPYPLFNIIERLINEKFITTEKITIEIAGNFETTLIENLKNLKVYKSINFLGQLPRKEVLKKYKETHLLWSIVGNKVSHYTGVPIKFYEYLASQRPIINFAPSNSEPSKIVENLNLGYNFNTSTLNLDGHVTLFKSIIDKYKKDNLAHKVDIKNITLFSRENQTNLLEKLF